jgi:5-methylcytosine-specific restriction enzyme subunit McrC
MTPAAPAATPVVRPVIELHEYSAVECQLTRGQSAALDGTKAVGVTPARGVDRYTVKAKDKVGSAVVGSGADAVLLRIRPKVVISRLMFLLGYAQGRGTWSDQEVDVGEADDLLPAVAHAFARAARRALAGGLLYGYCTVEDDLLAIRGRIRSDEMRRRYWVGPAIPCEYDTFTADIPENRLLLTAARHLLALPEVIPAIRRLLREIVAELADVTPLDPTEDPPAWIPEVQNARYHMALRLADLIVRGRSYEYGHDSDGTTSAVQVDGFLVEMPKVFEDFVTKAVGDALLNSPTARVAGRQVTLQERRYLDLARTVRLIPDLVCYEGAGIGRKPVAVLDAKYMAEKDAAGRETIYQMFAYCTALGAPAGHVVYTATPAQHSHDRLLTAGIRLVFHPLDLTTPIPDLRRQISKIASAVAGA